MELNSERVTVSGAGKAAATVAVVALAWLAWAVLVRHLSGEAAAPGGRLAMPGFDLYDMGLLVVQVSLPIALLSGISRTESFRRGLGPCDGATREWRLVLGLSLVFAVALAAVLLTEPESGDLATTGVPVLLAIGLIGGYRVTLPLGVLGALAGGLHSAMIDGPGGAGLAVEAFQRCLLSPEVSSLVWAGAVAGAGRALLGAHPEPLRCLLFGATVEAYGYLVATIQAGEPVIAAVETALPPVVVAGMTMAAAGMIVRGSHAETARQRASAAELELTRARLTALRAQINPHFMFNTLNTIRYLVRTDPEQARRLLLRLSDCLQQVLRQGELVRLGDELEYLSAYLELEKARFGERLTVKLDVDPAFLERTVPTLILQPIVENAIRHGIGQIAGGGTVWVTVTGTSDETVLTVKDDGSGMRDSQIIAVGNGTWPGAAGERIGLRNVDRRLRTTYGDEHCLGITTAAGKGTEVVIRVPVERP